LFCVVFWAAKSQFSTAKAQNPPTNCAKTNPGASIGRISAKVSENARAEQLSRVEGVLPPL
jgi:hypothetical protein